ncbi:peptidase inhibitor family I36 protein [Streptomyces sp. NPDC059063]|uniref:peptidase inhibitor family I36 protein n=1 Tax=unclassified Streptomyces TaxID=2593676 RepID=UPI0036A8613C
MNDQQKKSGREGNGMRIATSLKAAAATAVASAAAVIGLSAPADAAGGDGVCQFNEWCVYFEANLNGSLYDYSGADTNYSNEKFLTNGLGKGQTVANNARSGYNKNFLMYVQAFTEPNFAGTRGYAAPGKFGAFAQPYYANLESHYFSRGVGGRAPTSGLLR